MGRSGRGVMAVLAISRRYNYTYTNERTIEIPIVLSFIKDKENIRRLEVGNVLSHYIKTKWDILDKFENQKGLINEDVVNYAPKKKYDLIISISTLEHVGFDEEVKDPKKVLKSINNIKENCLKKGGKFIFTIPVGWNPNLDSMIKKNQIEFSEVYYFKRISWKNEWKISTKKDAMDTKFSKPHIGANGLVLGIIHK